MGPEHESSQFKNIVTHWADPHRYSPAPRHRRRVILKIINRFCPVVRTCLDVGCAQPYMLELLSRRNLELFGCDISDKVILYNREQFENVSFEEVDISKDVYPGNRKFDLVLCSEVLEHVNNWQKAVLNLSHMTNCYLLVTVPCGRVHKLDRKVGHFRHYTSDELSAALVNNGFSVVFVKKWGFPFHSVYKYAINWLGSDAIYESFADGEYGFFQKVVSRVLYYLFFVNGLFGWGSQLFILAKKNAGGCGI